MDTTVETHSFRAATSVFLLKLKQEKKKETTKSRSQTKIQLKGAPLVFLCGGPLVVNLLLLHAFPASYLSVVKLKELPATEMAP